jgi:hypothetical protein
MAEHGGGARLADIARWLVAIGRFPEDIGRSGQVYGQVYTAMLRHPTRFLKERPGTFRLTDEEYASGAYR